MGSKHKYPWAIVMLRLEVRQMLLHEGSQRGLSQSRTPWGPLARATLARQEPKSHPGYIL